MEEGDEEDVLDEIEDITQNLDSKEEMEFFFEVIGGFPDEESISLLRIFVEMLDQELSPVVKLLSLFEVIEVEDVSAEKLRDMYSEVYQVDDDRFDIVLIESLLSLISSNPLDQNPGVHQDSNLFLYLNEQFNDFQSSKVDNSLKEKDNLYNIKEAAAKLKYASGNEVSDWTVHGATLYRLYYRIKNRYEDIDAPIQYEEARDIPFVVHGETANRMAISEDVVLYYTLASELIDELSKELIRAELFESERWSQQASNFVQNHLKPRRRIPNLLYYTGTIDSGIKGGIDSTKNIRNKLVHDLDNHAFLDHIKNIETEVDRTERTIERLHQSVYDETLEERIDREIPDTPT